jgi:hypothetical protein
MGLRYSFDIITDRKAVDALLREVASSVTARDRDRLLACIPFTPETALRDLRRDEFERGSDICLAFLVEPTAEVVGYSGKLGTEVEGGLVPVGCVWTSLRWGDRFAYLSASAATSDMSRLFAASSAVQAVFAKVASRADCHAAYLYDESEHYRLIWPTERTFESPPEDEFLLDDQIDRFCAAVLTAAGLPSCRPVTGQKPSPGT